jgi:hypothetical protein
MKRDPEIVQAVKAVSIWPDIDIERDNARWFTGGDGRNSTRPARPPLLEHGTVSRRIEVPMLGERKFPVPAHAPWRNSQTARGVAERVIERGQLPHLI